MNNNGTENNRILCIAAHPDDLDFGAAGTIAGWVDKGYDISYLIATKGDAGGSDLGIERSDMAAIRQTEQIEAAKQVGVDKVYFLDFKDGQVKPDDKLNEAITKTIREVKPFRILGPSPEISWTRIAASHPDHLAVGSATLFSVYPYARNPFAFPHLLENGLDAHIVKELWLMASPHAFIGPIQGQLTFSTQTNDRSSNTQVNGIFPNIVTGNNGTKITAVDVSANFEKKIKALASHKSQINDIDAIESMLRQFLSYNAKLYGGEDHILAEAFQVVTDL
jgi:LmbE family N-acetylglucosaminyl deacetylase